MSLMTSKQKLVPVTTAARHLAFDRTDKASVARIAHAIRTRSKAFESLVLVRKSGSVYITENSLNAYIAEMQLFIAGGEKEQQKWTTR